MQIATAGSPPNNASRKTCRSCDLSNSIRRDPAVQGAARQPECLRGLADVARVAIERLPDEETLDVLERQIFELGRRAGRCPQGEVRRADRISAREEHRSLSG